MADQTDSLLSFVLSKNRETVHNLNHKKKQKKLEKSVNSISEISELDLFLLGSQHSKSSEIGKDERKADLAELDPSLNDAKEIVSEKRKIKINWEGLEAERKALDREIGLRVRIG
jgi:hypothetical protein